MTTTQRSRRTTSRRKGDANEQAILETLERLLAETPLGEISVEAIATGAGISRSSFYFYFASKEDVLLTLVDGLLGDLQQSVEAAAAGVADDPRAAVAAGITATERLWREHTAVVRAVVETSAVNPDVRAVWDAVLHRFVVVNAAVIRAERERGAAPDGPAPEALATALVLLNERTYSAEALGSATALPAGAATEVLIEIWLRAIYGAPDQANSPTV